MRLLAIAGCCVFLVGCGGEDDGPPQTAEEAAKAFCDAISKGDTEAAAALFDYAAYGRANNEDWDSIPTGQRSSIVAKLKDSKVGELATQFPAGTSLSFSATGQSGDEAVFALSAGGSLVVGKAKNGWKIVSIQ